MSEIKNLYTNPKGLIGIPEWYAGQRILITGATGFMGKVLVEKLLRECCDIETIYLLVRTKKGMEPIQRLEEYINCVSFDNIRENYPKSINKIRIIKGDVTLENLGLSDDDRNELISNVTCVFHCAACVRFDQPLREAVNLNTMGTYRMLQLAELMSNLKVFVHVSTAYCQCNEEVLEEKGYPPPHNPLGIAQMTQLLDDQILELMTPRLLNKLPNTYSYTKTLSEALVAEFSGKLPIVITRPSIVTAALKEPLPGWVQGLNGPTGALIGAGRGVIRTMYCNPKYNADVVPVDLTVNCLIAVAWERGLNKSLETTYVNVTLSDENQLTWGHALFAGRSLLYKNPLHYSLWYPQGSIKSNYYYHLFCVIFFHYLPAYFIDFLLIILRKKTFMVRVQKKISLGLKVLEYYTTRVWIFRNENLKALREKLSETDKEHFYFDMRIVNWPEYIEVYILGAREYLLKEKPETLPESRVLLKRLYYLDRFVKFLFYGIILYSFWLHHEFLINTMEYLFISTKSVIYKRVKYEE